MITLAIICSMIIAGRESRREEREETDMMYSEFIENTGAKDDAISFAVFSGLEHIYMEYDAVEREAIYTNGRKIIEDIRMLEKQKLNELFGVIADLLVKDYRRKIAEETTGGAGEYRKGEKEHAEQKERG